MNINIPRSRSIWVRSVRLSLIALTVLFFFALSGAAQVNSDLLKGLRWRNVGPLRGGRTRAVCGVPSQPNVFYMAQVNGGVWKTTDYGRTWFPIFDEQPTAS